MDFVDYTSQLVSFSYFGMVGSCTLSRGKRPGKNSRDDGSSTRTLSVNSQFIGGVVFNVLLVLNQQILD